MAMAALARRKASSLLLSKNLCSSSDAFKYSLSLSSFSRGFASGSGDNAAAAIKNRGTLVGCIPSKALSPGVSGGNALRTTMKTETLIPSLVFNKSSLVHPRRGYSTDSGMFHPMEHGYPYQYPVRVRRHF